MNIRLIWMFLAGLAVAAGLLLIILLFNQNTGQTQNGVVLIDTTQQTAPRNLTINSDLNASITPATFRTINESDTGLMLNGSAEAGAMISIFNNGVMLRQVPVNEDGMWTAELGILADQIMEISLMLSSEAQDETDSVVEDIIRSDEVVFRVPLPLSGLQALNNAVATSEVTVSSAGALVAPPALILVTAPGGPSRIVQSPFRRLPQNGALTLGPIDYDDLGGVIFSGTSTRPGRVRIYANDSVIGDTGVGPDGRWFYIAGETLSVGSYDVSVELMSADQVEARVVIPFERLAPPRPEAADDTFIKFESRRWQLRRKLFGGGAQYTAVFAPSPEDELPVPQSGPALDGRE